MYLNRLDVGNEDSVYLGRGVLAESNADLVARIHRILEELSQELASPVEARAMLGLKGPDAGILRSSE